MILDSEEQKNLLLQIFNSVNIPASQIEVFYELKKALESAGISKPKGDN
ncbi:MAG: hypothetical protein DDT19_00825 [Syntrophomonadaceae bacterium]|nr:hypothetical protein [Bacillota bacterium]